jgi:hypothetical protein
MTAVRAAERNRSGAWPANAKVAYLVQSERGETLGVVLTEDGAIYVEGVGTFTVLEEILVSERRARLAALAAETA